MASRFKPPSIDRLAEVDQAECTYQNKVVEIEGIVSPSGQSGSSRSDDYHVHCFSFSAWRRPGQAVVNANLTILRPVDPEGDWFTEYPKPSIHRIKVLLSSDKTRAIFAGESAQEADTSQLSEVGDQLAQPIVIRTERFGDLILDQSVGWFEGEAMWNGQLIVVSFNTDEKEEVSEALRVAEKLWEEQSLWKRQVEDYAVQELLSLKNDNWLGDGESPLTAEEFKSRMSLQSITIDPDGSVEFWHDDGDLFWGHSIMISGSLDEGLTQADIPG